MFPGLLKQAAGPVRRILAIPAVGIVFPDGIGLHCGRVKFVKGLF
jgi:hypothetical protein